MDARGVCRTCMGPKWSAVCDSGDDLCCRLFGANRGFFSGILTARYLVGGGLSAVFDGNGGHFAFAHSDFRPQANSFIGFSLYSTKGFPKFLSSRAGRRETIGTSGTPWWNRD